MILRRIPFTAIVVTTKKWCLGILAPYLQIQISVLFCFVAIAEMCWLRVIVSVHIAADGKWGIM